MFKHKLLIVPTILISSALLLSGCGANDDNSENAGNNSSSSAPAPAETAPGYVAPPSDTSDRYKSFFGTPQTLTEEGWSMYATMGATTYLEDPSARSTTMDEWKGIRDGGRDGTNITGYNKWFGEANSDLEQSVMNVSKFLAENPDATLDTINNTEGLLINRYPNLGATKVEQDKNTGFYFVVMTFTDEKEGMEMGMLVHQAGITPDEFAPVTDATATAEETPLDS